MKLTVMEQKPPNTDVQPVRFTSDEESQDEKLSRWERIREVIWDGRRSKEERQLVQRLDLFLL